MTEKQKRFCVEYLKDLNATQAAIRAGYSVKTASEIGYEYLRKPQIQEYINNELEDVLKCTKTSLKKRIIDELETMAFDPMIDEDSKIRPNDKIKSLDLLGKYCSIFVDKVELSIDNDAYEKLKDLYGN
jgi:phage terminase small subunit